MGRQSTGHPYVRLHKPGHKRVSCSIVKLACLTFHSQQPKGFVGYYVGNGQYDDIAPNTVWWMPEHEALNRNRRKLPDEQRWEVLDMYFEDEIPITKIAPLFNVSTSTIWEIIKKSKDRIKYVQY